MEQHSRPASFDDLKALIHSPNQSGAEYLLIGGYALFAHGYHRATTDIDLLVPANHAAGLKIRDVLLFTKQTARDKDVADRRVLERALAVFNARAGKQ
jgi:hypothetical protein